MILLIGQMAYMVKGIGSTLKWTTTRPPRSSSLCVTKPLAPPHKAAHAKTVRVEVAPQQIQVQVENGMRPDGLGKRMDGALAATGSPDHGRPVNAQDRGARHSVIVYYRAGLLREVPRRRAPGQRAARGQRAGAAAEGDRRGGLQGGHTGPGAGSLPGRDPGGDGDQVVCT